MDKSIFQYFFYTTYFIFSSLLQQNIKFLTLEMSEKRTLRKNNLEERDSDDTLKKSIKKPQRMQSIKENAFKIPQVESDVLEKYNESVTDIELARQIKKFSFQSGDISDFYQFKKPSLQSNENCNVSELEHSGVLDFTYWAGKLKETTVKKTKVLKQSTQLKILKISSQIKLLKSEGNLIKKEMKEANTEFFQEYSKQILSCINFSHENNILNLKQERQYRIYLEKQNNSMKRKIEQLQEKEKELCSKLQETDNSAPYSSLQKFKIKQSRSVEEDQGKLKLQIQRTQKVNESHEQVRYLELQNEKLQREVTKLNAVNHKLKQKIFELEEDLQETKININKTIEKQKSENEMLQQKLKQKYIKMIQKFSEEVSYFQQALMELKGQYKNENLTKYQHELRMKEMQLQEIGIQLKGREQKLQQYENLIASKGRELQQLLKRERRVYAERQEKQINNYYDSKQIYDKPKVRYTEYYEHENHSPLHKYGKLNKIKSTKQFQREQAMGNYSFKRMKSERQDKDLIQVNSRINQIQRSMKSELSKMRYSKQ